MLLDSRRLFKFLPARPLFGIATLGWVTATNGALLLLLLPVAVDAGPKTDKFGWPPAVLAVGQAAVGAPHSLRVESRFGV